jgi:hypothetical protein
MFNDDEADSDVLEELGNGVGLAAVGSCVFAVVVCVVGE